MRTRFSVVLTLVLVGLLSLSLVGCDKKDSTSADLGLSNGGSSAESPDSASSTSGSSGGNDAANPKSTDSTMGGDDKTSSTGGTTGNSGATTGGTTGGSTAGKTAASAKGTTLKIMWWNDTVERAPKNAEVVFGSKSYKPGTGKSGTGSIGPCPIGKKLTLTVYPDGRDKPAVKATFTVDAQMIANSETDAIHVEVKDTTVRVLGNPVLNFVQSFER